MARFFPSIFILPAVVLTGITAGGGGAGGERNLPSIVDEFDPLRRSEADEAKEDGDSSSLSNQRPFRRGGGGGYGGEGDWRTRGGRGGGGGGGGFKGKERGAFRGSYQARCWKRCS